MIDKLLSSSSIGLLERTLSFTEQRHEVIVQNIANVSTPGYIQQDVSVSDFQQSLSDAIDRQRASYNTALAPESTDTVEFSPASSTLQIKPQSVVTSPAFHDRGIRSPERLMTDLADNAQAHNMAAQMLRGRYETVRQAISMKV